MLRIKKPKEACVLVRHAVVVVVVVVVLLLLFTTETTKHVSKWCREDVRVLYGVSWLSIFYRYPAGSK